MPNRSNDRKDDRDHRGWSTDRRRGTRAPPPGDDLPGEDATPGTAGPEDPRAGRRHLRGAYSDPTPDSATATAAPDPQTAGPAPTRPGRPLRPPRPGATSSDDPLRDDDQGRDRDGTATGPGARGATGADADGEGSGEGTRDRVSRRLLLGGAAGAGATLAAGGLHLRSRSGGSGSVPDRPAGTDRTEAPSPADVGGFDSREESYVAADPVDKPRPPARRVWDTPSTAARSTRVPGPTILPTDDPVLHLLRRTTFGPTSALVDEVRSRGMDAWLEEQLAPQTLDDTVADEVWGAFPLVDLTPAEIRGRIGDGKWDAMHELGKATLGRQIWSRRQLFEVMVDFWANHLNVTTPGGGGVWDVATSYNRDVIRRHAMGSFTDMLLAANRHPAMLRYLSNHESTRESVNENLGRELLELHTVGIGAGYTESDVRNSAYILTGRRVVFAHEDGEPNSFLYDPNDHWTGPVQVLDFRHDNGTPEGGLEVGDEYLRHLAAHPATAHTVARKLAVRFVADDPPGELVERLAQRYLEAGTSIVPVLELLLRSSELWAAVGHKTRRPLENTVASLRVLDVRPGDDTVGALDGFYWWTETMGHRPLAWDAPNGYPDVHPPWRSASGILEVWNAHRRLVRGHKPGVAYTPVHRLLGDRPRDTVGRYVDSLCRRLCFQTFRPAHRQALVAATGAGEDAPTSEVGLDELDSQVAPLVLDSPYFALR